MKNKNSFLSGLVTCEYTKQQTQKHKGFTNNTERIIITEKKDLLVNKVDGEKHEPRNKKHENM